MNEFLFFNFTSEEVMLIRLQNEIANDLQPRHETAQIVVSFYLLAMVERTGIEPVTPTMST